MHLGKPSVSCTPPAAEQSMPFISFPWIPGPSNPAFASSTPFLTANRRMGGFRSFLKALVDPDGMSSREPRLQAQYYSSRSQAQPPQHGHQHHPQPPPYPASGQQIQQSHGGPYHYIPLKSTRNFRVLKLERVMPDDTWDPDTLKPGELPLLRGSLMEVSLDQHPEFFAVSYCWGNPSPTHAITLDGGQKLGITASCASVLDRSLRGKFSRIVWVDSICINQHMSDPAALQERGRQVAMMDEIYSRAVQVNVHLGPSDAASDVAMDAIKGLWQAYSAALLAPGGMLKRKAREKYDSLADDALAETTEFPYTKMHGVFSRPWFTRMWCLQEVALSRKCFFYCGTYLVHFTNLAAAADFTRLPYSRIEQHGAVAHHWRSYLEYHIALQEFVRRKREGEDMSFLTLNSILLMASLLLRATDPRDKVYGLYGVCKALGFELTEPDYRKPTNLIYTEAAVSIIRYDHSLEYLTGICSGPWDKLDTEEEQQQSGFIVGLPSWVPNFNACHRDVSASKPPFTSIAPSGAKVTTPVDSLPEEFHLGEEEQTSTLADGPPITWPMIKKLYVKGLRLDNIVAVGEPWKYDSSVSMLGDRPDPGRPIQVGSLVECIDSWFQISQATLPPAVASPGTTTTQAGALQSQAALEAMAKLVLALFPDALTNRPSPSRLAVYLNILVSRGKGVQISDSTQTIPDLSAPWDGPMRIVTDGYSISLEMRSILMAMVALTWKKLFRTSDGMLGFCSHGAESGDVLAAFHGSKSATVLRFVEPGLQGEEMLYRYVGPAHLIDFKHHGEGSDGETEWFTLV